MGPKKRKKKRLSTRATLIKRATKLRDGASTKSIFRLSDDGLRKYISKRS